MFERFKKWRSYNLECLTGKKDFDTTFVFDIYFLCIELPFLMAYMFIYETNEVIEERRLRKKDYKSYKLKGYVDSDI